MKKLLFITAILISFQANAQDSLFNWYATSDMELLPNTHYFAIGYDVNSTGPKRNIILLRGQQKFSILCDSLDLNGTLITPQRMAATQAVVIKCQAFTAQDIVDWKATAGMVDTLLDTNLLATRYWVASQNFLVDTNQSSFSKVSNQEEQPFDLDDTSLVGGLSAALVLILGMFVHLKIAIGKLKK